MIKISNLLFKFKHNLYEKYSISSTSENYAGFLYLEDNKLILGQDDGGISRVVSNIDDLVITYREFKIKEDYETGGIGEMANDRIFDIENQFDKYDSIYIIHKNLKIRKSDLIKVDMRLSMEELEDSEYIMLKEDNRHTANTKKINTYMAIVNSDTRDIISNEHTVELSGDTVQRIDTEQVTIETVVYRLLKNTGKTKLEEFRSKWSTLRTKVLDFHSDHLSEQIRTRYAMLDRPTNGLSNVVIDSFIPRMLYQAKFNIPEARRLLNAPKTAVCISQWFSNMFGIKQASTEQLCRILGYDKKDLRKLMEKVKKKRKHLCFIGYGGTNVNTIHWLNEIAELTNTINIFKETTVFEPERAEISNLLRFPLDPVKSLNGTRGLSDHSFTKASKLMLLGSQLDRVSKEIPNVYPLFLSIEENSIYGLKQNTIDVELKDKDTIIYGAPGISTRSDLAKYGNFISATHGDDSCQLFLNPEQDQEIQVESYGIIQLGSFFMNQLRLAIGLLETIARDDIDYTAQDVTLMEYTFNGVSEKATDRHYQFQNSFNGLIMTEQRANQPT